MFSKILIRKRMVKVKALLMAAGLLLFVACSKEDGDIQTKDVSFLFPVRCDDLHVSDIYAGEVAKSVHLTDVDTVIVRFAAMESRHRGDCRRKYHKHTLHGIRLHTIPV